MTTVNERGYVFHGDPSKEHSVAIDGVRLADFGVHLLADSAEPMMPPTRDKTITIPGRHGDYYFGSYFDARQLDLSCGFNNQPSLQDTQRLIRELNTLLLDDYGRPKTVELVYDYEPDKHYKARVAGAIPVDRIARAGVFTIPMIAHDPFAYSNVWSDEIVWGSEAITFQYDYLLGDDNHSGSHTITSPQVLTLYNYGYAVKPTFIITGSATELTVSANGKSFSLPAFSNATYEIDGELFTVKKDGVNAFNDFNGYFIEVVSGSNEINVAGRGIDIEMSIKYRFKYV